MTTFAPAYRLTIYEPRSMQSNPITEPDILAPVGGAHSDSFKVATISGVSGFQPYLQMPEGRKGRLDLKTRRLEQGSMTFTLLDKRTGTSNLTRWVTNFMGDSNGKPWLLDCKVKCEESTDAGSTWANFWTGRINSVEMDHPALIRLHCRDLSSALSTKVFTGRPHANITYAVESLVLPVGLSAAYGTLSATAPLSGTFGSDGVYRTITLATSSYGSARDDNVVTNALIGGGLSGLTDRAKARPGLRVRFTAGGVSDKEAELVRVKAVSLNFSRLSALRRYSVTKLWVRAVASADPFYTAMDTGTIADATACTFTVRQTELGEEGNLALLLAGSGDVHPVTVWRDLLDGEFGRLTTAGAVTRAFPYDSSAFSSLVADTSIPRARFYITEPMALQEWVEKHILQPYGLACRLDGAGQVVPIDLRPPQASPTSTTITDADLDTSFTPVWVADREGTISVLKVKTYIDHVVDRADIVYHTGKPPAVASASLVQAEESEIVFPTFGNSDLEERTFTVDAKGLRTFPDETFWLTGRDEWIVAKAAEVESFYKLPFSEGVMSLTIRCLRTANTTGCEIGDWRLLDCDMIPDPGSNLRGGGRLMRCVSRTERGPAIEFGFIDAGPNTVPLAPTIATPAQETSNTKHGITVGVTLNASSQAATLWINPTATSVGTRPSATDGGWRLAVPVGNVTVTGWPSIQITATGTQTVHYLPSNSRIWVRTRTEPPTAKGMASVWAYPAGTGYVDTAAITAPSSLTQSLVTTKSARLTWTNGDATYPVVLQLVGAASKATADAATPVDLVYIEAGATEYDLTGLDSGGPWWHPQVLHFDQFGGRSTGATIGATSFEATGTASTAPTPAGIVVVRDYATTGGPPTTSTGLIPVGVQGVDLLLVPAPNGLGLDIELSRAPDSSGSPGTYAVLATVPGNLIAGRGYYYRDRLPITGGTPYWYKCRHTGSGITSSGYTQDISAAAGWLPKLTPATDDGEPVLGQTETALISSQILSIENDSETFFRNGSYISTGSGLTTSWFGPIPPTVVPVGATITGIRARFVRNSGSDFASITLAHYDDTARTVIQTLTSTGTTAHTESATLSHVVLGTKFYGLEAVLNSFTNPTDARLYWVEIDYVRNSYRQ